MTAFEQALAAFRASRTSNIDPALSPSDAPATEEYAYDWGGQTWFIRREAGRYVYAWIHPRNEDAASLAEAEAALFAAIANEEF